MQQQQSNFNYLLKLNIVGLKGVGKTSIVSRYVKNSFSQKYATTFGFDFCSKDLTMFEKKFKLQLWENSGKQMLQMINSSQYKGSVGVIFVFDLTNRQSFQYLSKLIHQFIASNGGKARAVLIGNKIDLKDRCVSENQAKGFAERVGPYFQVSCKQQGYLNQPFQQLVHNIFYQCPTLQNLWKQQVAPSQNFSAESGAAPVQIMHIEKKEISKKIQKYETNYQNPYLMKCLIIGDSMTGKSNILLRYVNEDFTQNFISTIGVDFRHKTFEKNGFFIKGQLWDTAGQQRFKTITNAYYYQVKIIFLVYDCSNSKSFQNLGYFLKQIEKHCNNKVHTVLVANKCDLSMQTSPQAGQVFAEKNGFAFYEVSAKNGTNISKMFEQQMYKVATVE